MSIFIKAGQGSSDVYPAAQESSQPRKTIDARSLKGLDSKRSAIDKKRESARKQAMKLVQNAWNRDAKSAAEQKDLEAQKADKLTEVQKLTEQMKNIEETKKNLQEKYGVDPDSKEQKDLELLEKYQNNVTGASFDSFSEEEKERLKELQNTPFTDYQKEVLRQNSVKSALSREVERKNREVAALQEAVTDSTIDQLKSQDMLKAQDAAGQILDASGKEILNMLIQEGRDNIDEDAKEEQEKAEKAQEEKEKKQEKTDDAKEKRKEQEELLKKQTRSDQMEQKLSMQNQSDNQVNHAQKQIQKILKENHLVNEDLKGIEIDLNF